MTGEDIHLWAAEARALMRERLGLRGADLRAQVARAGRMLPRAVAREARYLAQVADLAQNPKLMRMIDLGKAARAHAILTAYLRTRDPARAARDWWVNLMGVLAFNLLLMVGLVLGVLLWRGLI